MLDLAAIYVVRNSNISTIPTNVETVIDRDIGRSLKKMTGNLATDARTWRVIGVVIAIAAPGSAPARGLVGALTCDVIGVSEGDRRPRSR